MDKQEKSRKDCYFGLHFDFHATAEADVIGITDRDKFAKYLDDVKPDFVQIDTKGHPGYASFFSEYGTVAPGLVTDQLKMIREETKKRGILLYAHYSGVRDMKACQDHPDWAIMTREGELNYEGTDLRSPYIDEIMIPQLCELAGKYGLDGAWVDGEVWAVETNYREDLVEEFKKNTGYTEISEDVSHPSNVEFRKIMRQQFRDYVKKYTKAVHDKYPNFEITSNYACSDQMPEMTLLEDLDYLSGDFASQFTARLSVRCFAGTDKIWDLMSWGHRWIWFTKAGGVVPRTIKNTKRLCRECAMVISAGGGYHIVNGMTQQGEIRDTEKESMAELAAFARERQPFCHHGIILKSTAVWYSDYDLIRRRKKPFGPSYIKGVMCDIVLDGGRPVDIIYDDVITSDALYDYPVVIIPDNEFISDEHRAALIAYMEKGGKVIACGKEACKTFVEVETEYTEDMLIYIPYGRYMQGINDKLVTFGADMEPIVPCSVDYMKADAEKINAAAYKKWGKGGIYCFGWDVCADYEKTNDQTTREIFRAVLDEADPEPWVYHESGIRRVEVMPTVKNGEMMAHIINISERIMAGNFDDFPPVYDITIAIKCPKEPKCVMEEPTHKELEFTYDGKYAHVKVPELDIHSILIPKY